jgi:hypothetical protein
MPKYSQKLKKSNTLSLRQSGDREPYLSTSIDKIRNTRRNEVTDNLFNGMRGARQ